MRPLVATAVIAAAALLAGCSSNPPAAAPTAEQSKAAAVAWSPCDGLTAAAVSRIAGADLTMQTGTTDQPRCTFVPKRKGGPAYDVNYLYFDGGLDAALDSMGAAGTQLRPVTVPGADAARLAVRERKSGILVTGFVQTRGLVQSVNVVDLKPYDRDSVVGSTEELMARLARGAPRH